jgi:XTP/dITP diphosphohydrolase
MDFVMRLIFATGNNHKLEEVKAILPSEIKIVGLNQLDFNIDLPETQETIRGNALQKAKTLFENTGLACFADDSGLEIFKLDGRPGVDSAHYAGPERDSSANIDLVLNEMKNMEDRSARFITVIAYVDIFGEYIFEGTIQGSISNERLGSGGFGYDPIFIPTGFNQSFAELSSEIKNNVSHRAIAVRLFSTWLINNRLK